MHTGRAILVILVVVVVGWLVLHHSTSPATHATSTPTTAATQPAVSTPATTPSTTVPLVAPASIKLQVLNGMLTGSLSGEWSAKLKANPGYDTLSALNATARVAASEIYVVTPGFQREADALAVAVGLPATAVNATTPPPATAPIPGGVSSTANLVLVIGPDLAGSA
jgi:LytR cell envelope-related transcriptional attenuator